WAALVLGCFLGWLAAWMILRQRLQHHRERIEHLSELNVDLKDQLAKKSPAPPSADADEMKAPLEHGKSSIDSAPRLPLAPVKFRSRSAKDRLADALDEM